MGGAAIALRRGQHRRDAALARFPVQHAVRRDVKIVDRVADEIDAVEETVDILRRKGAETLDLERGVDRQ